jgi:hypothetical protein
MHQEDRPDAATGDMISLRYREDGDARSELLRRGQRSSTARLVAAAVTLSLCVTTSACERSRSSSGESGGDGIADTLLIARPIAYFGLDESATAANASLPLQGAVLGQIAAIRAVENGRIAVLDAAFKKVVVFDSTGAVHRIIGKGSGQGPGEFTHPTAMDWDAGRLAVFDYSQNRVTVFDTIGNVIQTVNVRRAKDIALRGDTLWGTFMPGRSNMVWRTHLSGTATDVVESIPVDEAHSRFYPKGAIARLGRDEDGAVLVAHHRPGLWYAIDAAGTHGPFGVELLPGAEFTLYEGVEVSPGNSQGIFVLDSRRIVIVYVVHVLNEEGRPRNSASRLAVLDRETGQVVGQADLGEAEVTAITSGENASEIYYTDYASSPRVVKAVLEAPASSSGEN